MKKAYVTILFFFMFPTLAYANFVWPAMYMIEDVYSWKIIVLSTIIESLAVWLLVQQFSIYKSIIVSIIMNATSAVVGVFLLPISGIL